jgi:hypothetical protein
VSGSCGGSWICGGGGAGGLVLFGIGYLICGSATGYVICEVGEG